MLWVWWIVVVIVNKLQREMITCYIYIYLCEIPLDATAEMKTSHVRITIIEQFNQNHVTAVSV